MKKIILLLCLLLSMTMLLGCEETVQQVETIAQNVDVEAILTGIVESIDWEELQATLEQGYEALVEEYPALKSENIKSFIKENGLKLMNRYLESTDAEMQENARKLGEIIKILDPELTDEVDRVIG